MARPTKSYQTTGRIAIEQFNVSDIILITTLTHMLFFSQKRSGAADFVFSYANKRAQIVIFKDELFTTLISPLLAVSPETKSIHVFTITS